MEQAALAPTEAPEPQQATFQHATAVICQIVPLLDRERQPFAVEIEEDWPSGWRVHLKFRETRAVGLLEFAALLDVPVTNATTAFGVHLDAIARIETVEVRASALVSPSEAARLEVASPAPTPQAPAHAQATARPVPLGSSVLATQPAIVTMPPAPDVQVDGEDEARCVRCGCTENAACPGGCFWVPNLQMVDLCSACASPQERAAVASPFAPVTAESEQ